MINEFNWDAPRGGLIRAVYRCTMYSINGPRQFCASVAEPADGSKSLSWLKPRETGAFSLGVASVFVVFFRSALFVDGT